VKTAPLSPPPRPPKNGRCASNLGEPGGGGKFGGRPWWRTFLKFTVPVLFVVAAGQLAFILFQTMRLWFFS